MKTGIISEKKIEIKTEELHTGYEEHLKKPLGVARTSIVTVSKVITKDKLCEDFEVDESEEENTTYIKIKNLFNKECVALDTVMHWLYRLSGTSLSSVDEDEMGGIVDNIPQSSILYRLGGYYPEDGYMLVDMTTIGFIIFSFGHIKDNKFIEDNKYSRIRWNREFGKGETLLGMREEFRPVVGTCIKNLKSMGMVNTESRAKFVLRFQYDHRHDIPSNNEIPTIPSIENEKKVGWGRLIAKPSEEYAFNGTIEEEGENGIRDFKGIPRGYGKLYIARNTINGITTLCLVDFTDEPKVIDYKFLSTLDARSIQRELIDMRFNNHEKC